MIINKTATLSSNGLYRYELGRQWDADKPTVAFVMLNPSTADAQQDDPTIRKCIGFATRLGFGGIVVVNVYAYRATDPRDLKRAGYLAGPANDEHIKTVLMERADRVICAWGSNAKGLSRPGEILKIIKACGHEPMALQVNAGGIPAHPLMLPYTCELVSFTGRA